jgi:outer membrane protein assembly factor BamA
MKTRCMVAAACSVVAILALAGSSQAEERPSAKIYTQGHMEPTKSRFQRKRATRVRGFLARRLGFYSYNDSDVTNVYGGSRSLFGSTNTYRDPFIDRQTSSGPFDHGFFFDSGMGPRGGDSPYPR